MASPVYVLRGGAMKQHAVPVALVLSAAALAFGAAASSASAGVSPTIPPPRLPENVQPREPLTVPRVQPVIQQAHASWDGVASLVESRPERIARATAEAIEHLRQGLQIAFDAWDRLHPRATCQPIIEPICGAPLRHSVFNPAYGMVLLGPYAGRRLAITCGLVRNGVVVYFDPRYRNLLWPKFIVWTPWSPLTVPNLGVCARAPGQR